MNRCTMQIKNYYKLLQTITNYYKLIYAEVQPNLPQLMKILMEQKISR